MFLQEEDESDSAAEESGFIGISQRLNGTPGLSHYFTQRRPFQVGVKQSMKLFMGLSANPSGLLL